MCEVTLLCLIWYACIFLQWIKHYKMSLYVRKPTICMGENKDADQLRGNREADQRLCFRYTDSTFPPLLIPKISRFWVSSVTVQAGLCWTWSETQIVGFVMHRLKFELCSVIQLSCISFPLSKRHALSIKTRDHSVYLSLGILHWQDNVHHRHN